MSAHSDEELEMEAELQGDRQERLAELGAKCLEQLAQPIATVSTGRLDVRRIYATPEQMHSAMLAAARSLRLLSDDDGRKA